MSEPIHVERRHYQRAAKFINETSIGYCSTMTLAVLIAEVEEEYRKAIMSPNDNLEKVLRRWEGAVSAVERDGDDSPETIKELDESRAALLVVLRKAI